jgi:hypothetical protein
MKTIGLLISTISRLEQSLEAALFAATTVVVASGTVAVFVRLATDLA